MRMPNLEGWSWDVGGINSSTWIITILKGGQRSTIHSWMMLRLFCFSCVQKKEKKTGFESLQFQSRMHEPVHVWLPKEYYFTRPPKFWNSHSAPAHVSCHCARMMVEVGSLLFFYLIWDPSSWRSSLQKQGFSRFFTLGWHSSLWFVTLSSHVFKAPLFFSFFKHGLMGFWAGSCHRNPWSIRIGTVSSMHIPPTSQPTPGTVIQYPLLFSKKSRP